MRFYATCKWHLPIKQSMILYFRTSDNYFQSCFIDMLCVWVVTMRYTFVGIVSSTLSAFRKRNKYMT